MLIGQQPVQLRGGKLRAKGRADQLEPRQPVAGLRHAGALPQKIGDQLKLRHVFAAWNYIGIGGVAHKIQPRHAQTLFIHRIVIQRIILRHMRHADYGIGMIQPSGMAKRKGIAARGDRHLVAIGKLIIQRSAKVKVAGLIGCRCAHALSSSFLF